MDVRSIAAQVASSKTGGSGGNWINPGKGILIITALKVGTTPEFFNGDTFVAELEVESCQGFEGNKDEKGNPKPVGNQVGSSVSYVEGLTGKWKELAFGRVRGFILTLMGESDESIAAAAVAQKKTPGDFFMDAFLNLADRAKKPARGMRIAYSTVEKETSAGNKITVPKWETITQTEAEIAAVCARLDRKPAAAGAP